MNFKKYHVSRNLAPPLSEWVDGYINSSGTISTAGSDTKEKSSDYIELLDEQVITFSYPDGFPHTTATNAWRAIAFYKSDKTFLSRTGGAGDTTALTASVPGKAKYARLSMRNYGWTGNAMLNSGSTPLPYEPCSSEVWHDIPHYIHNTSTDAITTLPAVLYPNGTTATVGLKGQAVQSTTPTPAAPVIPEGTGERTGNLLVNEQTQSVVEINGVTFTKNADGSITANGTASARAKYQYYGLGAWKYDYDTNYFLSGCPTGGSTSTYSLLIDSTSLQFRDTGNGKSVYVPNTDTGSYSFEIRIERGVSVENLVFKPMLNTGSTALPYEPYGYKIPLSSANTTTPVYLGEVETTRRVKKIVLDGTENWKKSTTYQGSFYAAILDNGMVTRVLCTHAEFISPISAQTYVYGKCGVEGGSSTKTINLFIGESSWTVADFKSYLAAQYAAGTPVTIWYVLANEETAVVNEPLMKIGGYADEVSDISIPVTAGGDTLSLDTTVQPSEVTVNYKGWHPVQSVHEYDSNYTIATMQALTIAQLQTHTISDLQGGEWS